VLAVRRADSEPVGDATTVLECLLVARHDRQAALLALGPGAGLRAAGRQDALAGQAEVGEGVSGDRSLDADEREQRVFGADVTVTELACLDRRSVERVPRGGSPPSGPRAGIGECGAVPLLDRLLARPEELTDLRPRQARRARLGDETADQDVAQVRELAAEVDRQLQPRRGRLVGGARLDDGHELIDRRQVGFLAGFHPFDGAPDVQRVALRPSS